MRALIGFLMVAMLGALGCGGGDPCAGSPCPNDAKQTQSEHDACVKRHNDNMNAKCNQQSVAYELCTIANVTCNSQGATDFSATLSKINSNCKTQADAVLCCNLNINCK